MKKLLSLDMAFFWFVITILSCSALASSQDRPANGGIRDRFIGAWRLVWLGEPDAGGKVHRAQCTGLLVYTREGHMSLEVMYRNPQAATQGGPVQYAQGGYEAFFGTYQINGDPHTFTYHVEGALVRTLLGKNLTRVYEFSGKQLIVKSPDANEHWRVAWEHY